jgi:hypothetical protein
MRWERLLKYTNTNKLLTRACQLCTVYTTVADLSSNTRHHAKRERNDSSTIYYQFKDGR